MRIKIILIGLLMFNQAYGVVESARCQLRTDSLGADLARGRSQWAIKCYPGMRYQANEDGEFRLYDSNVNNSLIGYPSFVQIDANGVAHDWVAPTDPDAPCVDPTTHVLAGFCRAGCYTPDQMVLFSDGYESIGEAKSRLRGDIVSLSKDSTIDSLQFQVSRLWSYTVDKKDQWQKIAIIKTEEGGELKVTLNHPLVTSDGYVREASELKVGDKLISEDGTFEPIQNIEVVDYYGKVMNVEMATLDPLDNIVVAQGYLNGSVMYQNQATNQANREILRDLIPTGVLQ